MRWYLQGSSINRGCRILLTVCLLTATWFTHAQQPKRIEAGLFSSSRLNETLPADWHPQTFSRIKRHTDYSLVKEDDTVVVKAVSHQSASALARSISVSSMEYPVIQWRWKMNNVLQKGDVTSKDGDDYPARVYITFAFDPEKAGYLEKLKHEAAMLIQGQDVPYRAISYIWGSNAPVGTMIANPYTDSVMMFVVEAGKENLQQWVTEKRNVREDYKKAFGEEPPMISGLAIMTDTDNTDESAIAWYGDIAFIDNRKSPD